MSPTDILAADDHLASCEDCRKLARAPIQMEALISGLRVNLRSGVAALESDHPSYEQIVALVDSEMDETARDALESHLEICAQCAEDVNDLRVVRSEVLDSSTRSVPIAVPTWRHKITAFTHAIRLPLWPALTASLALLFIGASIAVFFSWRATRLAESPQRTGRIESPPAAKEPSPGSNTETVAQPSTPQPGVATNGSQIVLALNDASGRVTLDATGNVGGLGSISPSSVQAVKQALTTGRVEVPQLSELIGKKSTLLGTDESDAFLLLSPVGTITRTARPTLRWRQLTGATSYTVAILDADFNVVANSPSLARTSWSPPHALELGRVYSWQVTAVKDGKEIISPSAPAPEARFKVLDKATANELSHVERVAGSHLVRGTLYARAGVLDDAERELRVLLEDNPNSPIARKLLQSVRAVRSR